MHFSNTSYLKAWTWLLPCWIWKTFFEQLGKRPVRLEDRLRYAVRIDDEFVLIFDPATPTTAPASPTEPGTQRPAPLPQLRLSPSLTGSSLCSKAGSQSDRND